ncbi:MAG: exodeoxyribonuclease VII small subunit [Firmicutes bacterium]|nr:exodeoxyribonuclease VII small subunit [Bacillota bacterium]
MEEKKTFEHALEELEKIVKELESGSLSLEDSVKKYHKGTELAAFCSKELKRAEDVVVKLMNQNTLTDFNVVDEE